MEFDVDEDVLAEAKKIEETEDIDLCISVRNFNKVY